MALTVESHANCQIVKKMMAGWLPRPSLVQNGSGVFRNSDLVLWFFARIKAVPVGQLELLELLLHNALRLEDLSS